MGTRAAARTIVAQKPRIPKVKGSRLDTPNPDEPELTIDYWLFLGGLLRCDGIDDIVEDLPGR